MQLDTLLSLPHINEKTYSNVSDETTASIFRFEVWLWSLEDAYHSGTLVSTYKTTRCHNVDDRHVTFHIYCWILTNETLRTIEIRKSPLWELHWNCCLFIIAILFISGLWFTAMVPLRGSLCIKLVELHLHTCSPFEVSQSLCAEVSDRRN
jgi:hypothetical protein